MQRQIILLLILISAVVAAPSDPYSCKKNEIYNKFMHCEASCADKTVACQFGAKCACERTLLRDQNGLCVLEKDCPNPVVWALQHPFKESGKIVSDTAKKIPGFNVVSFAAKQMWKSSKPNL